MSLTMFTPEALGRIACFAAIELNRLGKNEETTVDNIISFSELLDGNFSITSPTTAYLTEPMSAYAVTSVFCDPSTSDQSIEEIFSKIDEELLTPLKKIAQMGEHPIDSPSEREECIQLASRCLAISMACTSVNTDNGEPDNELYW